LIEQISIDRFLRATA